MSKSKDLLEPTWSNLFLLPANYPYYEDGPHDPHSFSPEMKARWAVDSAILAYGRGGGKRLSDGKLAEFFRRGGFNHTIRNDNWLNNQAGCWAFFASNDNWAVLAFRGTADIKDVFTDADATMYHEISLTHPPRERAMVHKGFLTRLNQVWQSEILGWLEAYRLNHPEAEILFTGHSLGGALAALAAGRYHGNISLHTFGCPRVGNAAFCEAVSAAVPGKWFRYVDGNDWVTRMPLESMGFAHGGQRIHFGSNDSPSIDLEGGAIDVAQFLRPTPSPDLADHSPSRYLYHVWEG
jgi:triacylglycerol lipase